MEQHFDDRFMEALRPHVERMVHSCQATTFPQRIDIHLHGDTGLSERLGRIETMLGSILQKEVSLMGQVEDLVANIAEIPSINDSLDALFAQLAQLIATLKNASLTPEQAQALADANVLISSQKERTKAAIVANTPQA